MKTSQIPYPIRPKVKEDGERNIPGCNGATQGLTS
jgi:hypothetical protein